MIEVGKAVRRFREFGGRRLMIAYFRMGVLWSVIKAVCSCLWKRQSLKIAYSKIIENVEGILIKQYGHVLADAVKGYAVKSKDEGTIPKIIWTCWLQGMEHAPLMVKVCVESQRKELPDYEHRVLTLANYKQWVALPDYVEEKFKKGFIPKALFSDLLRLSVLRKYGGVWMDASVLCTGFGNEKLQNRWERIEQSDFTIFRYFERGTKREVGLSNWFIAARPNEIVISSVLAMLLAYWKDYNCTVDYYIMHLFIGYALQQFPSIMEKMPRENSFHSLMLRNVLGMDYNKEWWDDVKAHVFLHKLSYRNNDVLALNHCSFYNTIFTKENEE